MMNGVQGPAAVLAEKMQEIAAHIENFFERYGSSALAESDKQAIKDDIVRHAGKKRMLEENVWLGLTQLRTVYALHKVTRD
ncbi:hypothetical protein BM221_008528 [Beauveria bassiana]|uniref:Uncharacterized protein n=1 Tax=Beauveria bassiana TaxID=176275 RepID=A0A2N6ND14_BEABA|nr:hypothetical protein BM221_008528 [Beauveria bassiana]